MEITIVLVGKTDADYLKSGIDIYLKRLTHYQKLNVKIIEETRNKKSLTPQKLKEAESEKILECISKSAFSILLDEKGSQFSSTGFADFIQGHLNRSTKELVFIVGGAYGVTEDLKGKVDLVMSLSKLTFTHQMVRLFLCEQIYRAFTILRNEQYHND